MSNKHLNGYIEEDLDTDSEGATDAPTFTPTCPYCGARRLPMGFYKSQQEADEDAAMSCNCVGAIEHRIKREKERQREINLAALSDRLDDLARYCEDHSVPFGDKTREMLVRGGTLVLDGEAGELVCRWMRMRVKIKLNNKCKLQVRYSYTDTGTMEV